MPPKGLLRSRTDRMNEIYERIGIKTFVITPKSVNDGTITADPTDSSSPTDSISSAEQAGNTETSLKPSSNHDCITSGGSLVYMPRITVAAAFHLRNDSPVIHFTIEIYKDTRMSTLLRAICKHQYVSAYGYKLLLGTTLLLQGFRIAILLHGGDRCESLDRKIWDVSRGYAMAWQACSLIRATGHGDGSRGGAAGCPGVVQPIR